MWWSTALQIACSSCASNSNKQRSLFCMRVLPRRMPAYSIGEGICKQGTAAFPCRNSSCGNLKPPFCACACLPLGLTQACMCLSVLSIQDRRDQHQA